VSGLLGRWHGSVDPRSRGDSNAVAHAPEEVIGELEAAKSKEDSVKRGIELCARTIQAARPRCQGAHVMPMGWRRNVSAILSGPGFDGRLRHMQHE